MSDLRERLAAAATPIQYWTVEAETVVSVDKAIAIVAAWLRELAAEQWKHSTRALDESYRTQAAIRAMYLTDRALELEGDDPHDLANATDPQPERTTP